MNVSYLIVQKAGSWVLSKRVLFLILPCKFLPAEGISQLTPQTSFLHYSLQNPNPIFRKNSNVRCAMKSPQSKTKVLIG
ncbi:hypothetical protein CH380_18630 [Leptospira adleri]|uniref:Uncharacterized protein n=1 Tax=Leptospira adleri TaxID=2023186 RepID=A0A2M9YJP3_9LEPT|nr:hypothetical protein CH380_18630 [Leptospira adleri]PJZ60338.1 hypothetical protein CH376_18900 [Leptospira adleri]